MNILLCSVPFAPSIGGIETLSALLIRGFAQRGHAVVVVTQTPAAAGESGAAGDGVDSGLSDTEILRQPGAEQLVRAVRRADVVLHNQISLRLAWPLLAWRRPWVVAHHTWLPLRGPGAVKRRVLGQAVNVAVSRAVASSLPVASRVIANAYDPIRFGVRRHVPRDGEFLFVGRLVSDKGCDLLLAALRLLRTQGLRPRLSIVGSGPEEKALWETVAASDLGEQVRFHGPLTGEALVVAMNRHRWIVVPSAWEEPFGLVALEGLACGCLPVVAQSGGLPEAAGPEARLFARGDAAGLAQVMADLMAQRAGPTRPGAASAAHLLAHRPDRMCEAYLDALTDAIDRTRPLARAA